MFEELLSAVCSRVEPASSNASQDIYMLGDAKEARLAYDILIAHGFDAKIYPESDGARLYVTRGDAARMPAAITYAKALKNINQSLETLRGSPAAGISDYSFNFSSDATGGRIAIQFRGNARPAAALPPVQKISTAAPVTAQTPKAPVKNKYAKKEIDPFTGGPALGKRYPFESANRKEGGLWKWFYTHVIRNIVADSLSIFVMVVVTLVILTLAVMSKGFLCPDFAQATPNRAWYCTLQK